MGISRSFGAAVPIATAFLANACIMAVELVAGRIISRHVGMSLYTWTSIIALILLGMSLGNYLGGMAADRVRPRLGLAVLFLASAVSCMAILPLNEVAGRWGFLGEQPWSMRIFLHVAIVFLLPAAVLGALSPFVAKSALDVAKRSGRAIGGVFAAGAAGSIVGTFLTGYYLVFHFRASVIVITMAGGLGVIGLFYLIASMRGGNAPVSRPVVLLPHLAGRMPWAAYATVFLSNMAFMVIQMGAMRLVSRQFGSSLYSWTTIIGVMLAGITFGNYMGGRLADRVHSRKTLGMLLAICATTALVGTAAAAVYGSAFESVYTLAILPWPVQITLYAAGFFLLPCVALGTISPMVIRLMLAEGRAPGGSAGGVYGFGAIGGVTGTLLAGFYLIGQFGTLPTMGSMILLLGMASVLYAPRSPWTITALILSVAGLGGFAFGSASPPGILYERESDYSYIAIKHEADRENIRTMVLDKLVHSEVDLDAPTELKYEYEFVYEGVLNRRYAPGEPLRSFIIGGGGFTFPRYLELTRPGSHVEVAEIDPEVTEAAFAAFGVPRDTTMAIYNMDARNRVDDLLREAEATTGFEKFDCVFGDSINDYAVPYHLTTLEFVRQIRALLRDDGIYMLNMIDMLDSGRFLGAVVHTCREVFPHVRVFNTGRPSSIRDTFIVVASSQPLALDGLAASLHATGGYLGSELDIDTLAGAVARAGSIILTDDYAPVENLLLPVVRTRTGDVGDIRFEFARKYRDAGDDPNAIAMARSALEIHPQWPEAETFLADMLMKKGDSAGAVAALRNIVSYDSMSAKAHMNLALVLEQLGRTDEALESFTRTAELDATHLQARFELGKMLFALGRTDEAIQYWSQAVTIKADYVPGLYNLGLAYAGKGEFDRAIAEWEKVLAIEPAHTDSLHNTLLAQVLSGKIDAARATIARMRAVGVEPDAGVLADLEKESGRQP